MASKASLKRELNTLLLSAIGIGAVIGSGIFTMPGLIAGTAGPMVVVAIVIMALVTALYIFILAELGAKYPKSGAIYYFPLYAFGDLTGFITGWSFYACCFIGTAAIIYSFLFYLNHYIPGLAKGLTLTPLGTAVAIGILAVVTFINILGIKYGAWLNFAFTVAKVIPLIVFIIAAFAVFKPANFHPFNPFGAGGLALAIAWGFWMFGGFESLVLVGEEVKEAEKTIRRSALTTILTISIIYLLVMISFVGAINWSGLGLKAKSWGDLANLSAPLADVARAFGSPAVAGLLVPGVCISTAGCFSDWVLLQGRVVFALARERRFWKALSSIHPKYMTPAKALIFSSILTAIVMILIPAFPSVTLLSMITEFIPYGISALALAALVKSAGKLSLKKALMTWGAFVFSTFYLYWACWPWTLTGCIIALSAIPVYLYYAKGERSIAEEIKKNYWYIIYLVVIPIISLLGDQNFVYANFLPIGPLNIIRIPYDMVVLAIFATIIYFLAYRQGLKHAAAKASQAVA